MPKIEIETGTLGSQPTVVVRVEGYPPVLLRAQPLSSLSPGLMIWHFTRPDGTKGTSMLQSTAVEAALGIETLPNWPV